MSHWKRVCPLPILEISYEDLVNDPESGSRELIEFCGLAWDERCLNFHENERKVQTASLWQVRQPIYTSAVGHWRNYQRYLEPLLQSLRSGSFSNVAPG